MSVVIGIPTQGRREPLLRLLRSVVRSCARHAENPTILIVQNDAEFTLEGDAAVQDAAGPLPVVLHHEPRAGLCYVRNRLLDEADGLGADWFLGLDDDEWVSEEWFAAMMDQATDPRQILFGPCHLVYDETLSIYRKQARPMLRPVGAKPPFCATGNFGMNRRFFAMDAEGFRFDLAFNAIGGEDEEFFARIGQHSDAKMIWVPEAIMTEERIAERATLSYAFKRSRRIGMTRSLIKIKHAEPGLGTVLAILQRLGLSIGKMVNGGVLAAVHFASIPLIGNTGRQRCGGALAKLCSGFGGIEGLIGLNPSHYGQDVPDNAKVRARPSD